MTWTKLSDDFTDDCWTLSDAGYRLHSDGLIWSNRKLLDLRIPKEDVARFAKRPDAIQELLDLGFWIDAGTSYVIRHHATYQRLREAVIKQQEISRNNGSKGGRPAGKPREQVKEITQQLTQEKTQQLTQSQTQGYLGGAQPAQDNFRMNAGEETQQVTQQLTQQLTQRDRTGMYEEVTNPFNSSMNDSTPIQGGGSSGVELSPEAINRWKRRAS